MRVINELEKDADTEFLDFHFFMCSRSNQVADSGERKLLVKAQDLVNDL